MKKEFVRAVIETGFIVFLFYSNLLVGEFERANGRGRSLVWALGDIFTTTNFVIAVLTAFMGHLFFELLRKKL